MITPGYGPTATERVLPRMALDFTTASLDARVTVSRALNTATRVNSSGLIETVNANLPRFDFSPTSIGTCQGLLIEESRINIAPSSESFTTNWTALNATVSASAGTSPTGANNAVKLVTANSTTFQGRYCGLTLTSGVTYVVSVFVKAAEITKISLGSFNTGQVPQGDFDLIAKTATGKASSTAFIYAYPDNWYRCVAIRTATASGSDLASITLQDASGNINFAGNGVNGALIWGYDFQVGAFPTSYIPNTGTGTTTRNADVVDMTGTNFSDWYNATEGSFVVSGSTSSVAASRPIMQVSTGALSNGGPYIYYDPAGSRFSFRYYTSAGAASGVISYTAAGTPAINTNYRWAFGYKTDAFVMSVNGNTIAQDTSGEVSGTPDTLRIGNDTSGTYINGCLTSVRYWPQRFINAETQAFSK